MGGLIRKSRTEARMGQAELAEKAHFRQAAISELERGKVQVSARDLYLISQLLTKPIEYFYGEDYGEKEIQDLISVIRKQPPEARNQSVVTITMFIRLFELGEELKQIPENEKVPTEIVKQFIEIFIPFSTAINLMTVQLNDIRDKLLEEMKIQGIQISPYPTDS